jgi:hypothetical protein
MAAHIGHQYKPLFDGARYSRCTSLKCAGGALAAGRIDICEIAPASGTPSFTDDFG